MNIEGDPSLPAYEVEGPDMGEMLNEMVTSLSDFQLPIASYPPPNLHPLVNDPAREQHEIRQRAVQSFFDAIESRNKDVVAVMIENNLVSTETTDRIQRTPLIAAVESGDIRMVQCLVDFGADIDAFGTWRDGRGSDALRTPLQVAAATGHLALVRLLIEVFHADDALLAPDGELALRLAAEHGHREIVAYLPARRRGGWRRWKTHHAVAMKRARQAGAAIYWFGRFFLYEIPRFFLWSLPKHLLVLPLKRSAKWAWTNKHRLGPWAGHQARELPRRLKRAAVSVGKGIKKIPKALSTAAKDFQHFVAVTLPKVAKKLWQALVDLITKRIPALARKLGTMLWSGLKELGAALAAVVQRLGSFIHTLLTAVVSFFKSVSLRDVWNGFCQVLHAIFVTTPIAIWKWLERVPEMIYHFMTTFFGALGAIFSWLAYGFILVILYVPRKLLEIVSSLGGSATKGWQEILVWFDPKR